MRHSSALISTISCCLLELLLQPTAVVAAEAPPLPRDPAVWINSAPITLEQVRGKAVFLWFFEEDCPRCRGKWPMMIAKAAQMKDKPIVFIAVNSGNSPAEVREYARSVNTAWPVLADVDRSFEKAVGVPTISLNNIEQFHYITHDGAMHEGNWQDLDGTVSEALEGATWKIDPMDLPPELKDARLAVEYGNYKAAATALKKFAASSKREIQEGAKKIQDFVQNELTTQFDAAKQARDAGESWKSYEIVQRISDRYAGFELPDELSDIKKDLAKEPAVKAGSVLRKALDIAMKGPLSGRPLNKKARTQLEKIVADYPETDMSREAEALLQQSDQSK